MTNPTEENVKIHWGKHCERVEDAAALKVAEAKAGERVAKLRRGESPNIDVDENLKWIIAVGRAEVEERMKAGQRSGITVDHVLNASDALTRRSHNEAQHELLGALTGGIAQALTAKKEPKQIEGAEVVEAEAVLEAEVVE